VPLPDPDCITETENAGPAFEGFRRWAPCLIWGEPDAIVAYLHPACDAVPTSV